MTRFTSGISALAFLMSMGLAATEIRAQVGRIGVEASGGYHVLGGDDFDGFDNAFGFEAIGSYAFPSGLELGVGAGIASHDVDGSIATSADVVGIFGEGRYRFGFPAPTTPHLHPFVAGRLGWSRISLEVSGETDDPAGSGLLLGLGGGVEYWFTDAVAAVGAGTINWLDVAASDELPDLTGRSVDFRVGLKVRF
jgi:hypothetical protein